MSPGTNFKKLFTLVIYQFFVAPGKLFQPSLMFAGKAGAKPREELSGVPLQGRLMALLTNFILGLKGVPGTNTFFYIFLRYQKCLYFVHFKDTVLYSYKGNLPARTDRQVKQFILNDKNKYNANSQKSCISFKDIFGCTFQTFKHSLSIVSSYLVQINRLVIQLLVPARDKHLLCMKKVYNIGTWSQYESFKPEQKMSDIRRVKSNERKPFKRVLGKLNFFFVNSQTWTNVACRTKPGPSFQLQARV